MILSLLHNEPPSEEGGRVGGTFLALMLVCIYNSILSPNPQELYKPVSLPVGLTFSSVLEPTPTVCGHSPIANEL